jgi:two-component system phosphate regulon response regulator PhoB
MPNPASILIVEDEADMARILEFNLSQHGCRVAVVACGRAAVARVRQEKPDLVLLDLRLPDVPGQEVLKALRQDPAVSPPPVIIVSALGDEETVVEGLNLGAEDYVNKPFRVRELLARVDRALRRQARPRAEDTLQVAEVEVDVARREVRVAGQGVELTRTEFDLLLYLIRQPGRVFTRQQLCNQALGAGGAVQERTIDAHVRTIRRKLGPVGARIETAWGIGYKFSESLVAS